MIRMKAWMVAALLVLAAAGAMAEPMRTRLTKENRFPDYGRVELGLDARYAETEEVVDTFLLMDVKRYEATPFARYQAFPNVSLVARLPYVDVDPDVGSGDSGLGDASLGFEWRAYEAVFGFPFVIPHAALLLDTGDEKKGLGRGETGVMLGITLGTKRWEDVTFTLDASYTIYDESDNVAMLASAILWDISRTFSVLAEAAVTDEEYGPDGSTPWLILGGLSYQPYDRLAWTVFGGGGENGQPDVTVGLRLTVDL